MEEAEGPQPCLFCGIASKKIPSNIVYEDDYTLAFLDINPLTEGHTLIIPKTHVMNLFDISQEELNRISVVAQKIAKRMKEVGQAEGVNLVQASGEAADQTVPHFHMHVIPRKTGDGLDLRQWWMSRAQKMEPEKLKEIADRLKIEKAGEPKVEEVEEELEKVVEDTDWMRTETGIA